MKITAVIVAGGKGTRMGADKNKVFLKILGREVLYYTISAFEKNDKIDDIIVVTGKNDIEECQILVDKYGIKKVSYITEGGATRQESVMNGLKKAEADIVLIHDGARALVTDDEINNSVADCIKFSAAAVGVKCKDTLKSADNDGFIAGTVDREKTFMIQTPQVFYLDKILDMHQKALDENFVATDDCMIAEHYGVKIKISDGSYDNIKLTTPEDMIIGERILRKRGYYGMRIGQGYDVHKLVEGRDCIICGVKIPYEKGLLGHSDADVALHALADAILGAAALGDIGKHFPDTDEKYKGADSRMLLREVVKKVAEKGYSVGNADVTIVAQRPKMLPYIEQMRKNVADDLNVGIDDVNIKATTTEKLGFEGRGEGISATAVVLLK